MNLLPWLIAVPLLGFISSLLIPSSKEKWLATSAIAFMVLQQFLVGSNILLWLNQPAPGLEFLGPVIYSSDSFVFRAAFYLDRIGVVFLAVGSILTFLICVYSRYYMHRESGYKRFFNTIQFFFLGYNLIVLSGNFEMLFTGWEILGISSFLLIAFYRDRFLPVKNAFKIFSIYRLGDAGLIVAAWLSHIFWHENILFSRLNDLQSIIAHLDKHSWLGFFMALALLVSASAKSAQFPFSSWLPRAMEGPTPSSAIFYGSLSVHMGCFILLRTFPLWENQLFVRFLFVAIGLLTAFVTTGTARVQSSIKSQIAYSSLTQIGLIFVEIALGLETLALFHFAGNAFLRTYQLLVSPSVVSYMIREQFYKLPQPSRILEDSFSDRLRKTLYILCLKEWNMDTFMENYLWKPFKLMGRRLPFMAHPLILFVFTLTSLFIFIFSLTQRIPEPWLPWFSGIMAFFGLSLVLRAFAERRHARHAWTMITGNHVWIAVAVSINDHWQMEHFAMYLSGVLICWIIGLATLRYLEQREKNVDLNSFQGHVYDHPYLAFIFLLACLGLSGFPITPTFIGEDLIFHHISLDEVWLGLFVAVSYILDGIAIIRIYSRVFLGPHIKTHHEVANRSA